MACVKGDLLRYCCRFLPLAAIGIACSTGETSAESFDDSSPRHPHGCHPRGPALCVNKKSTFLLSIPSQSRCARQLPQRGSPWHFGQLLLFVWVCSVVKQWPRSPWQLLLTSVAEPRCFFTTQYLSHPARPKPACQWLSLWESWQSLMALPERVTSPASYAALAARPGGRPAIDYGWPGRRAERPHCP